MKTKKYTLEEVLFGLRKEEKQMSMELEKLKNCCEVDSKTVKDLRFWLDLGALRCSYETIFPYLGRSIVTRRKLIGENSALVVKGENYALASFIGSKIFPAHIKKDAESQSKFKEQTDKILSSEFAKNTKYSHIAQGQNQIVTRIDANTLSFTQGNGNAWTIEYWPEKDQIYFASSRNGNKITMGKLQNVLEETIDETSLNPYHIKMINQNGVLQKPIVLKPFEPTRRIILGIKETPKYLILAKAK